MTDFNDFALDIVHVLPEELSNQIAAGEVVERPASAVRELVENALDAGATRIEVEIEEGGSALIRVTDNGRGMSERDAERCIQRHATSKIRQREDLFRIASYGFRGEALPSIASVSRFELISRTKETLSATRVLVEGGNLKIVEPWSAPIGTSVTVRDIFFNTPARRKFLKTRPTENRNVIEAIEALALPRPDVSFQLTIDGRVNLKLLAVDDVWQRIADVVGYEESKQLFPAMPREREAIEAWGFISAPTLAKKSGNAIKVFVNGRLIRDSTLSAAVRAGYEGMVDRGRSPVVFVFVKVPLDAIDVNVHPAKTEVRFGDPQSVFRAVRATVRDAVMDAPWIDPTDDAAALRRAALQSAVLPESPVVPTEELKLWSSAPAKTYRLQREDDDTTFHGASARWESTATQRGGTVDAPVAHARTPMQDSGEARPSVWRTPESLRQRFAAAEPTAPMREGYFQSLHYIGPLHRLYLLLSGPKGLVVIDQHAAHERITFESLRTTWRDRDVQVQQMLVPDIITLSNVHALTLQDHFDFFASLGFEMEEFGGNDIALRSVPDWFGARSFQPMLLDALDDLADVGATVRIDDAINAVLSRMACHGSIRAGDTMAPDEVRRMLVDLDHVDFGANCPHGRPVYLNIDLDELESRFERR